jgi:hypothetical protein
MAGPASLSPVIEDGRRQTIGLVHPGISLDIPGGKTSDA